MSLPPSSSELLQPSLVGRAPAEPLLSSQATFLTSFLGGPFAALYMMGTNFRRLGRLQQEAPLLALVFALGLGSLTLTWIALVHPEVFAEYSSGTRHPLIVRRANNFLGMIGWGLCYLRMRVHLRAASLAGLDSASPWKAAAIAIVLVLVIHGGFVIVGSLAK